MVRTGPCRGVCKHANRPRLLRNADGRRIAASRHDPADTNFDYCAGTDREPDEHVNAEANGHAIPSHRNADREPDQHAKPEATGHASPCHRDADHEPDRETDGERDRHASSRPSEYAAAQSESHAGGHVYFEPDAPADDHCDRRSDRNTASGDAHGHSRAAHSESNTDGYAYPDINTVAIPNAG